MPQNDTANPTRAANFHAGDTVLVRGRPKSYKAKVEHVDRALNGDPVKALVRPLLSEQGMDAMSDRARNVRAKFILEVVTHDH